MGGALWAGRKGRADGFQRLGLDLHPVDLAHRSGAPAILRQAGWRESGASILDFDARALSAAAKGLTMRALSSVDHTPGTEMTERTRE